MSIRTDAPPPDTVSAPYDFVQRTVELVTCFDPIQCEGQDFVRIFQYDPAGKKSEIKKLLPLR
jgi:hypothetical protein